MNESDMDKAFTLHEWIIVIKLLKMVKRFKSDKWFKHNKRVKKDKPFMFIKRIHDSRITYIQ